MAFDEARESLLIQLRGYQSRFLEEVAFKDRFIDLIENFPDCFSRELPHAHITGSAWVVDETLTYALMTHHAKLDRWLQLGGHADGEHNVKSVSKREAEEESGLSSLRLIDENIFDLDIHTIPQRKLEKEHQHFDMRYLFFADRNEEIRFNHESKKVAWIPLGELDELTDSNRSILRMVEKTSHIKGKVSSLW